MELYNISNLSYSYPGSDRNALSDISLKINKGEFVILCGSSGSGKSTLLNLMKAPADAGTQKGKISFGGHFAGFVTQFTDEQIVCDKVWHELAFGAESIGLSQNEIRSQVSQTALFFGIEDLLYCDCDKLSGGQKQIINLASVMAMNPDVLLLDEPLSQLDPHRIHAVYFSACENKQGAWYDRDCCGASARRSFVRCKTCGYARQRQGVPRRRRKLSYRASVRK